VFRNEPSCLLQECVVNCFLHLRSPFVIGSLSVITHDFPMSLPATSQCHHPRLPNAVSPLLR
ncbi:hypothetical protein, partial [Bacteroides heparinolyticus]|uniref:hypothetical protein n=1 Tax=Prevotella heparinolytica TaxID=28113 RepID=UPI0035A11DD0